MSMMPNLDSLRALYEQRREEIRRRLKDFSSVLDRPDEEVFAEFVFCLLTPQSKARACDAAVKRLFESGMIFKGDVKQIQRYLEGVRFPENKSKFVVEAREKFFKDSRFTIITQLKSFSTQKQARDWLVKNVKGFGYKEAAHFLRNIGMGDELAILDKHILKNLHEFGVVRELPISLTPKRYFEIEDRMERFAREIGIPFAELDLLFWSKETGEVFK